MELLTIDEFADRMKISRTTTFDWIRKGVLKAGRDYIKVGRVIRIKWSPDLLQQLQADAVKDEPAVIREGRSMRYHPPRREKKKPGSKTCINFDY